MFVGFLSCQVILSILDSSERGHCAQAVLEGESIYINYLEFVCTGDLSVLLPFVYLFDHLFISEWTHGYLFYT